jgi:IS605 OrfB family transposase
MKLTAQIKLLPVEEQHEKLLATLERANEACDWISGQAWDDGTFSQYGIHKLVYYEAREHFELSAQMTVRAIAKVADAYKTNPDTPNSFSIRGGFPYDSRVLTYYLNKGELNKGEVSIWALGGRERIPITMGKRQRRLMENQQGESDLVYHDGAFYLLATCNVEEPDPEDVDEALGVDFGIENIATDSDGEAHSGAAIDAKREWYEKRRAILQSVGTRSAKRRLQQLSGRQGRFQRDVNHCISKHLVQKAKGTGRGIAMEDLSGIRDQTTVSKAQRSRRATNRRLSNWAFHDLRQKIEYKAALAGVPVYVVDPAYTSQTCSRCGHREKANRRSQSEFVCQSCEHNQNADHNAAVNIAARAFVNEPMVASEASGSQASSLRRAAA